MVPLAAAPGDSPRQGAAGGRAGEVGRGGEGKRGPGREPSREKATEFRNPQTFCRKPDGGETFGG
jgi:hypothetical protein